MYRDRPLRRSLRRIWQNFPRLRNSNRVNPDVTFAREISPRRSHRGCQRRDRETGSSVKSQLNRRDALPLLGGCGRKGRRDPPRRILERRQRRWSTVGARGGLQIRLVSGNACIIGTPTPSTTRPRASHGQVIMNRGLESKPRAGRGARLTSPRRLADTRAEVRESGSAVPFTLACASVATATAGTVGGVFRLRRRDAHTRA